MSTIKKIGIRLSKAEMKRIIDLIEMFANGTETGFRDGHILKIYTDIQNKFKERITFF